MDAPRPESRLGDREPRTLVADEVPHRDANVVEGDLGVAAVVAVVVAEDAQRPHDLDSGRITWHENHRLLPVPVGVGVGLAHHDEDRGIGIHRAGRPPLATRDDVRVAVATDARADVGRVGGGDVGLGHAE